MGCCKDKCTACQKCFQNFSSYFLVALNLLTALIGLACIASGAYFWFQLGNLASGLNSYTAIGPIAFGAFLFLLSIFGFCGVRKKSRPMLAIYFVLMLIMTLMLGAAGVLLLIYAGYINNAELNAAVADFTISVYDKCCVDAGFSVDTIVSCSSNPAPPCFNRNFDISEDVCALLKTVELPLNGSKVFIVGNSTAGGCGGDAGFAGFQQLFLDLLSQNLVPVGIGYLSLVALLLLILASACAIFCQKKDEFSGGSRNRGAVNTAQKKDMQVHRAGSLL